MGRKSSGRQGSEQSPNGESKPKIWQYAEFATVTLLPFFCMMVMFPYLELEKPRSYWEKGVISLDREDQIELVKGIDRAGKKLKIGTFEAEGVKDKPVTEWTDDQLRDFLTVAGPRLHEASEVTYKGYLTRICAGLVVVGAILIGLMCAAATISPGHFERYLNEKTRTQISKIEGDLANQREEMRQEESRRRRAFDEEVRQRVAQELQHLAQREEALESGKQLLSREKAAHQAELVAGREELVEGKQDLMERGQELDRRAHDLSRREHEVRDLELARPKLEGKIIELRALIGAVGPQLLDALATRPLAREALIEGNFGQTGQ